MSVIPTAFINAVVAIGEPIQNSSPFWFGSGFIVGRRETHIPQKSTIYIITNKHVVNGKKAISIRFNSLGDSLVKDYCVNLIDEKGNKLYSEHPNPTTDVIAIQIIPQALINDKSIWGAFDLNDNSLTLEQMQLTGVDEGSLVYALGFPMNLVNNIKTPICRLGCISRVQDAFILKNGTPQFLVDAQTFPGNSGGPIISRPEAFSIQGTPSNSSANLIGILSSYIPYRETLYSKQTGSNRMVQEENSGLTIVHPVDRIKEVVELEWQRIESIKANNKQHNDGEK